VATLSGTPGLAGRSALVTGASRGIGRAVAIALADEGARVWGLARSGGALAELSSVYGIMPVVADLADDTATWLALDEMTDVLDGAPDIVVNAAGVFGIESCATESVKAFDAHLNVNLRGPFIVTRALLPDMLDRGSGIVINIGSVAGRKAFPGNAAYSASKFGLRGFHEVLAEELRGTGVRATLVEPAATDTELWDPLDPDSDEGLPNRADMLGVSDVASAVLFAATRPDGVAIPLLQVERG
jgi:NADP-dependent 3-hydroxy acid dehydrogenase YdfG